VTLWQPRSGCDPNCLPAAGSTPAVPLPIRIGRLLAVFALLLAGGVLLPVLPLMSARGRSAAGRSWARALLRGLGVRLVVRGRRPMRRALLVSNHVSWLDIPVMLAIAPCRLLAKHEVRNWPVIGWLAAAAGTVFIDRSRPKRLPRTVAEVTAALRADAVVTVFPEGTTWCGSAAGRFRPAMFQAAIDAGAVVVPVRLTFRLSDGESTSIAAFLGEETLWASLRRVLSVRGLVITATAGPALHPDVTATRRMLARVAESSVGMLTPVDRPQATADISAVDLDLAA
jgi:1-acyl-sn-glycerol-3-phosphate acyltransferase